MTTRTFPGVSRPPVGSRCAILLRRRAFDDEIKAGFSPSSFQDVMTLLHLRQFRKLPEGQTFPTVRPCVVPGSFGPLYVPPSPTSR